MASEVLGTKRRVSMNVWRRVAADPYAYFSKEEVDRSKQYQRPLARIGIVSAVLNLAVIVTFVGLHVGPRVVKWLGVSAWPLQMLAIVVALQLTDILDLPVNYYRTFVHEKKWGFSTQTLAGWVSDQIKNFLIGLVVLSALFIALWWVIRSTAAWWIFGAAVLLVFGVLLVFLGPVVIMPLFNKFKPAEDEELRTRLRGIAEAGGIVLSDVLVMDASKRTRHDNAFFTGLGRTKRVVIFDNMLTWEPELVDTVVAHEVGHWKHKHLLRGIATGAVFVVLMFAALEYIMSWKPLLDWAGVSGVSDPAAMPLFALAFGLISFTTRIPQGWISRGNERQADLFALNLMGNLDAYRRVWKRFSDKDLPDLDPSWWKRLNASHPPIAERLEMGEVWSRS